MGEVKIIGPLPVGCSVQPGSVGTNGFGDAKRPTWRLLKLSEINICQLGYSKICIANLEEPGFERTVISPLDIVWAARLISFENHPCLHFLQLLSQHVEILHHLLGKLICYQADFWHAVGIRDQYRRINLHRGHKSHVGPKWSNLETLMVHCVVDELSSR